MTERTVHIGMTTYTDPDGIPRIALAGETVDVHPDHVKRFDELNGAPPEEKPPPQRRPAKKK